MSVERHAYGACSEEVDTIETPLVRARCVTSLLRPFQDEDHFGTASEGFTVLMELSANQFVKLYTWIQPDWGTAPIVSGGALSSNSLDV